MSAGDAKNNSFGVINWSGYFIAVKQQESFHSRVADAFITVSKRMITY